jgi:hypothetical protein
MVAGLAASASVLAQEDDSQDFFRIDVLLEMCEAEFETRGYGCCIAYVMGYRDGITVAANRARLLFDLYREGGYLPEDADPEALLIGDFVQRFCAPTEVTTGQLAKVFVKWATDHPERHHEEWNVGLLAAWGEAFPCE